MSAGDDTNADRRGGCQCGRVGYRLNGEVLGLAVCHCKECQRQSGSAFGMSLAVANDTFELTAGELRTFDVVCDSGRVKQCAFCPDCGTRIYHQTANGMSVKPGTLDDTSWLVPDSHYWTQRKQTWIVLPDDVDCFVDDN